jgi:CRP-like cAMP-binding protein
MEMGWPSIPVEIQPIWRSGRLIHLRQGEPLKCRGGSRDSFYWVISGYIQSSIIGLDGRRWIRSFHLPNEFFCIGEGGFYNCVGEAISEAVLITTDQTVSETLFNKDQAISGVLWDRLAESVRSLLKHSFLLARATATEKLSIFLLDMAERLGNLDSLELPMSRAEIGDYLGLTSETVTRTFTNLEKAGCIRVRGRHIDIVNRVALERRSWDAVAS